MTKEMIPQGDVVNIWGNSPYRLTLPEPDPPPEEYLQWRIKIFNEVNKCSTLQEINHLIVYHLIYSTGGCACPHYSKAVKDLLKAHEEANGEYYG